MIKAIISLLKSKSQKPKWDTWEFYMQFYPRNPNPYPKGTLQYAYFNRYYTPALLGDPTWVLGQLQERIAALGYSNREGEILAWHGYGPDFTGKWKVVGETA